MFARPHPLTAAGAALLALAMPVEAAGPVSPVHGRTYTDPAPMNATVRDRILPQTAALLDKMLAERRAMTLDGVPVFDSGDKFLPGKIAAGLSYLLLDTPAGDPRLAHYLKGYRDIADMTVDDHNDSWGIYYYVSALYQLKRAGLLDRAISPETLAKLQQKLDWRRFVDPKTLKLIHLPNNYYGVAFSVARLRYLLGWEDASGSDALLARMIDHYQQYSGSYGFADETDGSGRFDRYSVLLIGEISQRFIETGMKPTPQIRAWLRRSVDVVLERATMTGEGFEYGRSIGAYGDTAYLEILSAAATLGVLSPREREMAYALSSRITQRYSDFWLDPATGSVNLWDKGRRTDDYRGKHRILGENLSLARQYIYTNAEWNRLGFRDKRPSPDYAAWLRTLPTSSLTWFARGKYDRALLTVRDGGHVIGLPLINGAASQHMHNPYFPIPYAAGMLQGSADATFPQLLPRFTLADGSVLMPLAWFTDVRVTHQGNRTILTYRMPALDRMGGDDAVADTRMQAETRYVLSPGSITRTDRYRLAPGTHIARTDLELATFSTAPRRTGPAAFSFRQGEMTGFSVQGIGRCQAGPATDAQYRSPVGAFATLVACSQNTPDSRVLEISWKLDYR